MIVALTASDTSSGCPIWIKCTHTAGARHDLTLRGSRTSWSFSQPTIALQAILPGLLILRDLVLVNVHPRGEGPSGGRLLQ